MSIRRKFVTFAAGAALMLTVTPVCGQTILFQDAFQTAASSANYTQVSFGQTAVTHAFDYSVLGIPVAPSTTDGSTLGVKFEANMSAGALAAVTLHTTQTFTGTYTVAFDAWINANGPFPAGGTGSTQFLTSGVGGNGVAVNRINATGSGGWTAVDGEGQSSIDYRMVKDATTQGVAEGQYAAGTQATARDAGDLYYAQFGGIDAANLPVQGANAVGGLPQQNGTIIQGSVGFAWRRVELRVNPTGGTGGVTSMSWLIDDLLIGKLDAGVTTSFSTEGRVTIGYSDPFISISDNPTLSFGLIDNLRVEAPAAANDADFDGDSDIDGQDFLTWQRGLGLSGGAATLAAGNANGDTVINGADLAVWRNQFGLPAVPAASAVPEPAALIAMAVPALIGLTMRRRPASRRIDAGL